jgi:regulator of replication initiation timing
LSEHFVQKSEEEINLLRLENASLKSYLNNLQSETMHKNNEYENEQILQKQVKNLQVN